MAYTLLTGSEGIRKEVIDNLVKVFAQPSYVLKEVVSVTTTGGWQNTYYQEDPAVLTAPTGNSGSGLPRGANFPQISTANALKTGWITKVGFEDNILYEDIIAGNVDKQARTVFKLTQKTVYTVDLAIKNGLTEDDSPSTVNNFTVASGYGWDKVASASIIDDLMQAKQLIAEDNYPVTNLVCLVNAKDHRSIVNYLASKGAQFPSVGEDMATNGFVGKLAGITIRQTETIPASFAIVLVPKVCATWKELVPLQSDVHEDPFKSTRIRVVEEGMLELTDPSAVCVIRGTRNYI
ncbi:hypothetical protein M0R04_15750 [Candidatus Dojkabacteria bacterium]|jgi:hypothetical protein|nr:hypothetical protein [Candidatus Dojkabacteria bacterium]